MWVPGSEWVFPMQWGWPGGTGLGIGLWCLCQLWKQAEATVRMFLSPKRNVKVQILLCKKGCFLWKSVLRADNVSIVFITL